MPTMFLLIKKSRHKIKLVWDFQQAKHTANVLVYLKQVC